MGSKSIKRFDVYWVQLDPTVGSEIKKTRPCVVISPNELHFLKTCIIAPLTSKIHHFPCRVITHFQGAQGEIALDQLRSVDISRLVKKMGELSSTSAQEVIGILLAMFDQ